MNFASSKSFRIVFLGIASILLILFVAYLGLGYYIYDLFTVVHPECGSVYMDGRRDFTPASFEGVYYPENTINVDAYLVSSFETVEFPAREDSNQISAWFVPAVEPSGRVVIVVHGADVCRRNTSVLLPGGMLANNGFDVLLIDLRNHGDSEVVGKGLTAGVTEYKDVLGAFDWLVSQGYAPGQIGVLGISLGSATSINAFGAEPQIAALWADSGFADIPTVLEDQLEMNGLPKLFSGAVLLVARLNGTSFDADVISPVISIQNHQGRPVTIVHGTDDEWVNVRSAYVLYEASGQAADLWIIADMRHVEAMFVYPEEYQARLIEFFDQALAK
jgi:uncharacterized protein